MSGTPEGRTPEELHAESIRAWERNAEAWTLLSRQGYDRCRDHFNTPTFMRILPEVRGLRGLDIGCGEGHNTRLLAKRGALMTALDAAPTFIRHAAEAERAEPLGIRYQVASATALPCADASFDFATAFMSLQDVADQDAAVAEAFRVLRPGGFLQFSITHPCFQTSKWGWLHDEAGRRTALTVGDYFTGDGQVTVDEWCFGAAPEELRARFPKFRVLYFKRTLSSWLNLLLARGFALEEFAEPTPDDATLRANPEDYDARLIAYFLIVRCRKPAAPTSRPSM
jgi:ubiquinone/menaquinone biosynthesis C-methylase UbiE